VKNKERAEGDQRKTQPVIPAQRLLQIKNRETGLRNNCLIGGSSGRASHLRHGLHLAFGARRRLDVHNELDA